MLKKLLFIPPVLLGIAALAYFVWQRPGPETRPPQEQARAVRIVTVEPVELVPRITGFGAVRPGSEWVAASQVAGEIEYVHPDLKKGAILSAGTEIVRIAPADFELAIVQAEANIRAVEASIAELSVGEQNTRAILEIEQRTLDIQTKELERKRGLLSRGTVSQAAYDAESRATLAQQKKVQDLRNSLRLIPTQRAVQQEQKAVDEAQLAAARLDLARTRIRLPFDARIATVEAEIRQFAQVGQILATADGLARAEIEAQVPAARFRGIVQAALDSELPHGITPEAIGPLIDRIGFDVEIILRADDQRIQWPARFARISDTIDPKTRTVGVIAVVDGAYAKAIPGKRPPLTKGMFVEMVVRTHPVGMRLAVPRSALRDGVLYLANADNRLEIRTVVPGLYQGDIVTVREGLAAGERVIVSDMTPAIAGMLLRPVQDDELMAAIGRAASASDTPR